MYFKAKMLQYILIELVFQDASTWYHIDCPHVHFLKDNLSIRIYLTIQIWTSMNKNKDYAKMILNRLNSKATNSNLKSNSNSNQKTQATPTHNLPSTDPRSFF